MVSALSEPRAAVNAIRLVLMCLYTLLIGPVVIALSFLEPSGRLALRACRLWVHWNVLTFGVSIEAEGLENVPRDSPVVILSNHQSLFDIAALTETLPVDFRFVAKKELVRVPVFGWAMWASGHIVIDRGSHVRAVARLERAADRVRSGVNVIVYPEGTRSPESRLRPFKSGGFHLAIQAQVPILPVTVSGSNRVTPKGTLGVRPGPIKITYGEPIPTRGLTVADRKDLKRRVREAIARGYDPELQGPVVIDPDPPISRPSQSRAQPVVEPR